MRSNKELYQVILDRFDEYQQEGYIGICIIIFYCWCDHYITKDEYEKILKAFQKEFPKRSFLFFGKNSKFARYPSFQPDPIQPLDSHWWTRDEEGNIQRKLFLQHLIKKEKC